MQQTRKHTLVDDVILNRAASIQRCIDRVYEEYIGYEDELERNLTRQDAIVLNIQRACKVASDLGSYIIRKQKLGIPQTSRDVFSILEKNNILPAELSKNLQAMVGFRNIAIHEYEKLNVEIIKSIIEKHSGFFSV